MVSKISLEFQLDTEDKKGMLSRYKIRSSSKNDTKLIKTMSVTPRVVDISNRSSKSKNVLEEKRVSYHSTRPKPPRAHDTKSHNAISNKPENFMESRLSVSPKRRSFRRTGSYTAHPDYEKVPSGSHKTYYNERIQWNKRISGDLPLCIINFNGILGDWCKSSVWSIEEGKFKLVEGVKPGIKLLQTEFYVVIISWYSRELTKILLKLLNETHIDFDAFYIVRHRNLKHRFRHNYNQIYEDFCVQNAHANAIVMAAVTLTREEITQRQGLEMFYEKSLSGCNKYTTIGFPVTCPECPKTPLCILIPHYKLSDNHISFFELTKFVFELKNKCDSKLEFTECTGEISLPCEHQDIPLLVLHPIYFNTTGTRYIFFLQYKKVIKKPPITRKSSRIKTII
jgi:hypothetical protein